MLQGNNAPAMRELVEVAGGTVTHDLPLINAVGAQLTPTQLRAVITSPQVIRHITDVSIGESETPEDTEPPEPGMPCDIAGALELEFEKEALTWSIFNKRAKPGRLQQLQMTWPVALGKLESLTLNGESLASLEAQRRGSLKLGLDDFAQHQLPNGERSVLLARFSENPPKRLQADYSIALEFDGDCGTALVPGYPHNAEDSYFPTVVGADQLHRHGVTGDGVTVAILDSGLWDHPQLTLDTRDQPRVLSRFDAITNQSVETAFDESGHGTHMASVIVNSGPTTNPDRAPGSFKGIAPDANLVVVKAFNVEGQGNYLDIVRGIQYVVDHRETFDIRVLNLSFAARPRWHYWEDPINQALMHAWAAGITIVAAAGNEGPDVMSMGSPGNLPYAITVGAITDSWTPDDRSDDYIPDFSSRGPTPAAHIKPDLVAPGGHITGLTRPDSTLLRENPEYQLPGGEFVLTGTSQAAAVVSGMVALLLQLQPELSPDDVKCKFTSSAEPAIGADGLLAYSPFQQGHGYASVTRAITLGETGCANQGLDIARDIAGHDHFEGPAIIDDHGNTSLPGLEQVYRDTPQAKGFSTSRKWGVKAHIERPGYQWGAQGQAPDARFDWERLYQAEKAKMDALARKQAPTAE